MNGRMSFRERWSARLERIRKEGSPYYTYQPGIIAAGADDYIYSDSQFPLSRKYSPLDWIEVANNGAVSLTVTLNGNQPFPCPAGTIRTIDEFPVRSVNIHNDDAAAASVAGLITLTLQRQPITQDKFVRRFM